MNAIRRENRPDGPLAEATAEFEKWFFDYLSKMTNAEANSRFMFDPKIMRDITAAIDKEIEYDTVGKRRLNPDEVFFSDIVYTFKKANGGAVPPIETVIMAPSDYDIRDGVFTFKHGAPIGPHRALGGPYAMARLVSNFNEARLLMSVLVHINLTLVNAPIAGTQLSLPEYWADPRRGYQRIADDLVRRLNPLQVFVDYARLPAIGFGLMKNAAPYFGAVELVEAAVPGDRFSMVMGISSGDGYAAFLETALNQLSTREDEELAVDTLTQDTLAGKFGGTPETIVESMKTGNSLLDMFRSRWLFLILYASLEKDVQYYEGRDPDGSKRQFTEGRWTEAILERWPMTHNLAERLADRAVAYGNNTMLKVLRKNYGVNMRRVRVGTERHTLVERAGHVTDFDPDVDRRPLVMDMLRLGVPLPSLASAASMADASMTQLAHQLFTTSLEEYNRDRRREQEE